MPQEHAIIIGGSSGIGLATAHRLLADGLKVTIFGRDPERLARAEAAVAGVVGRRLDAADSNSVREAFAATGGFTHLVLAFGSNAGVGPLATLDLAEVRRGFEEKVYPQIQCAQLALPHLAADGSLTFISAISAHAAAAGLAGIGAANAAIASLAPNLAVELKPRRVNAVSPGIIETPWWDFVPEEQRRAAFAHYAGATPVGRNGTADDVADAIAFLVGNRFVTGQTIVCDGGLTLAA